MGVVKAQDIIRGGETGPGHSRLLITINKQESVLVNSRIFSIESIVILECWRLLTTK